MEGKLKRVKLELLDPHPDNPRVVMREDVVGSILVQLREAGGFAEMHAPIVREVGGRYQTLSGHHRAEAARRAALGEVPVWVVEVDDEAAYMLLATGNSQGELAPLEIGLHALKAVPRAQGRKGKGLSQYAELLGKTQPYVSQLRDAAEVAVALHNLSYEVGDYLNHAKHLYEIHALPRDDAVLAAAGANKTHGLRRTNADKRRAVEMALSVAGGRSDHWIAERCGVSPTTVGTVRASLSNLDSQVERKGRDGRTTRTANIGRAKAAPPTPEPATATEQMKVFRGEEPTPPPQPRQKVIADKVAAEADARHHWLKELGEVVKWLEVFGGGQTDAHLDWNLLPDSPGWLDHGVTESRLEDAERQLARIRVALRRVPKRSP